MLYIGYCLKYCKKPRILSRCTHCDNTVNAMMDREKQVQFKERSVTW